MLTTAMRTRLDETYKKLLKATIKGTPIPAIVYNLTHDQREHLIEANAHKTAYTIKQPGLPTLKKAEILIAAEKIEKLLKGE